MVRNGDADTPIWAAEYGWVTLPDDWAGQPSPWGEPVDAELKADYLIAGYLRAQREWPWMGVMAVWTFRFPQPPDSPEQAENPTRGFAIVEHDFTPRPAYTALRRYAPLLQRDFTGAYWLTDSQADALDSGEPVTLRVSGDEVDLVFEGTGPLDISVDGGETRRVTLAGQQGSVLARATITDHLTNDPHDITLQLPAGDAPPVAVVGYIVSTASIHTWIYPWIRVLLAITFALTAASTLWMVAELKQAGPDRSASDTSEPRP
jgi:hypothetical protein